MNTLEFLAQRVWPLFEKYTNNETRCKTCILTESAVKIHDDGICEECKNYTQPEMLEENENSLSLINDTEYLVMLSGGKDSAYLLHKLVTNYPSVKFKPILVDNGFMAPKAISNAQNVCKLLGLELTVHQDLKETFHEAFKNALINLNGKSCYREIDGVDGSITFNGISEYAAKNGITNIITGLSREQLIRIFNLKTDYIYTDMNLNTVINPLALWNTSETKIRKYVKENNLIRDPGPLATNSQLVLLMGILDIKNSGYSSFEPEFASLVRQGKADREYWIKMFSFLKWATNKGYLDKTANKMLGKFGLSLHDVIK